MIDLSQYHHPAIEIHLDEPGIYVFQHSSASGKTYLCASLRKLSPYERVDSLTFSEVKKVDPNKLFDNEQVDLVMLDRYDMYRGQFLAEMIEFSRTGIVLIDCKSYRFPMSVKSCGIYLYDNRVVVL